MKNYKWLFLASAIISSGVLAACGNEEEYEEGAPETEGCYGIYFPAQTLGGTFDPTDTKAFDVIVARKKASDAISVPLEVIGNEDGYFEVPAAANFADGQSETSVHVTFENIPLGEECSLTIQVTDPQYALKYASNSLCVSATFLVEKWNSLGIAKYRDDFFTALYGVENLEWDVEVQENDNQPGLYRLVYPYDGKYAYNDEGDWDTSTTYYLQIHAENPEKVYILTQPIGVNWGYGMISVSSYAGYLIANGKASDAESYYGKLENGIITFPTSSLLFAMANYNSGALYYANKNSMFRVCLPGAADYSLDVKAGFTENGVVPVTFEAGADVASIKYAVYEGTLNDSAVETNASSIASGKETTAVSLDMTSMTAGITLGSTGVYTLVAAAFDATGTYQTCTSAEFTYVAAGDEEAMAVIVSAGLELTSRYEGSGYTKKNSLSFYVYGSELTDVKIGLSPTASLAGYSEAQIYSLAATMKSVDGDILAEINDGGYSDVYGGLSALTGYTLVVYATNGYEATCLTAQETTEGLALVPLTTGTYTYDFWWKGDDTGLTLCKDPNYQNTYVIRNWGGGVNFTFTYDPATGEVNVPVQYIGDDHSSYGSVYVVESLDYFSEQYSGYSSLVRSSYDATAKQFRFSMAYIVSAGYFGNTVETFTLDSDVTFTSDTPSASAAAASPVLSDTGKRLGFNGRQAMEKNLTTGFIAGLKVERECKAVSFGTVKIDRPKLEFSKDVINDKAVVL